MKTFKQYFTENTSLRDSLINTGKQACGYMNCQLFVQTVTKIPNISSLPSKPFVSVDELKTGDILKWEPGYHWAIYIGDGEIMEVSEWGASQRVIPLDKMLEIEGMDPPVIVYSTNKNINESFTNNKTGLLLKNYIKEAFNPNDIPDVFDAKDGIGQTPNNMDVDYKGYKAYIDPYKFQRLVNRGVSNENTTDYIVDAIKKGMKIGQPMLYTTWDDDNKVWRVTGHEGRSRSRAFHRLFPGYNMEVHVIIQGAHAKHLTKEQEEAPLVSERELMYLDSKEDYMRDMVRPEHVR